MLPNRSIILKNVLVPPCYQIAPSYRKMSWYPHATKLLHHIEKCVISNKAINIHYRGPTEQHFLRLGASSWVPPQGEKSVLVPPH